MNDQARRGLAVFLRTLGALVLLEIVVTLFRALTIGTAKQVAATIETVQTELIVALGISIVVGLLAVTPAFPPLRRAVLRAPWAWIMLAVGILYFLLPLIATINFALHIRRDYLSLDAFTGVIADPEFGQTFGYSFVISLLTIVVAAAITVPAAYLVRLRLPQLRPIVEFVTLLPLIIPPIILVFGYIRLYNTSSLLPLTGSAMGTNILLILAYVALGLPYMYRAVDTGLRSIDVRTLTEAATILGARQTTIIAQIIFPNILVSVLSGAFLTFAIVIGEFTMASLLARPAFGTYLQRIGITKVYYPQALSIITFVITWGAMGMIQLLARFAPKTARIG